MDWSSVFADTQGNGFYCSLPSEIILAAADVSVAFFKRTVFRRLLIGLSLMSEAAEALIDSKPLENWS